jgi:hypothetical protein
VHDLGFRRKVYGWNFDGERRANEQEGICHGPEARLARLGTFHGRETPRPGAMPVAFGIHASGVWHQVGTNAQYGD